MNADVIHSTSLSDQEFISQLFANYERLMYYTVRKYISDPHQREDIVQTCLEKLIDRVQTLKNLNDAALANYIVVTVKNTSINYLKRKEVESSKYEEFRLLSDLIQVPSISLDDIVIYKENLVTLRNIWPLLDEETRLLLECKYFLGYDNKELAKMLGCAPSSIRMKLTRARRSVLKKLKVGELIE